MENTVENNQQGNVLDDAALNPVQETAEPLSQISEITEQSQQPEAEQQQPPQKEPGWIRRRVDTAVNKALQEQEVRLRAEFEATLAPIRESMYERQAAELVAAGEFKTQERALEYVKLKAGVSVSATPQPEDKPQPQRDGQGRFAPKQQEPQTDPAVKARADLLASQAEKIKTNRGVDVMQAFNSDPGIQQKVLSGEWDFYDVLDAVRTGQRPPLAPVRSPNGASSGAFDISKMSDAQFAQLQKNLAEGKIYDAR